MIAATADQVRQATQSVLASPEFLSVRRGITEILIQKVLALLGDIAKWSAQNPSLAKIMIVALTLVLLGLLAHLGYVAVREFGSLRKPGGSPARPQSATALDGVAENRPAAFKLAQAALEQGDIYRALWIAHRILLSILDAMGQIKFVRSKTNTDYLRECRDNSSIRAILRDVTNAYERVVYAHHSLDRGEAGKLLEQVEALSTQAGQ